MNLVSCYPQEVVKVCNVSAGTALIIFHNDGRVDDGVYMKISSPGKKGFGGELS